MAADLPEEFGLPWLFPNWHESPTLELALVYPRAPLALRSWRNRLRPIGTQEAGNRQTAIA